MHAYRRIRRWALAAGSCALAGAVAAGIVLVAGLRSESVTAAPARPTAAQEARSVAERFFRAIDTRRFGGACDLLSARFYQLNAIPSRQMCVLSLTYGMSTAGVRYRILASRGDWNRAEVTVLADGVRGQLQLVREGRSFKIVSLGAAQR